MREAQEISSSPSRDYTATPLETDLFEWHFTLRGPPNSAFAGGLYHGRIVLPASYPLRPPSFRFTTPSGRFETNREICLSISGHHEETWQPAWGVRTALVALRAFMETDAKGQLGGLDATDEVRRRLAAESGAARCAACGGRTNREIMTECEEAARKAEEEAGGAGPTQEVAIPTELKMGWKDEMGNGKQVEPATAAGVGVDASSTMDAETAELAEGFVETAPRPSAGVDSSTLPARPAQSVPQPTRTVPVTTTAAAPVAVPIQQRRVSNMEVPAWIDRLIVVLGIALVAMILRVFMT